MVMQPGRLTTLHLRGVRSRFTSPIGLYLLTGLLLLALFEFLAIGPRVTVDHVDLNLLIQPRPAACVGDASRACEWTVALARILGAHHPSAPFVQRLLIALPYVVFLALPGFALIVAVLCRRDSIRFAGHFAFAAHLHAFCFLMATLTLLLPGSVAFAALFAGPAYALCAFHEVYDGRWRSTAVRALGTLLMHLALIVAAAGITAAWTLDAAKVQLINPTTAAPTPMAQVATIRRPDRAASMPESR